MFALSVKKLFIVILYHNLPEIQRQEEILYLEAGSKMTCKTNKFRYHL